MKLFSKEKPVEHEQQQQPKRGIFAKAKDKLDETKRKAEIASLVFSLLGALFFAFNSVLSVRKKWTDSALFPFVIGATVVYVIVFVIFVTIHLKNSDKIKSDVKKFKYNMRLWKIILNLLFIATSLLAFVDGLQSADIHDGMWASLSTWISGALLFIKLVSTFLKLNKTVKKHKKEKLKQQQKQQKLQQKEQKRLAHQSKQISEQNTDN